MHAGMQPLASQILSAGTVTRHVRHLYDIRARTARQPTAAEARVQSGVQRSQGQAGGAYLPTYLPTYLSLTDKATRSRQCAPAGGGERLHTQPSHPTLGETSGFQPRNGDKRNEWTNRWFWLASYWMENPRPTRAQRLSSRSAPPPLPSTPPHDSPPLLPPKKSR